MTSTCERTDRAVDSGLDPVIDAPIDAFVTDGCTPGQEICGNDIDEDCDTIDPACAANDVAGGAINVTAGGMFTGDALAARDDVMANGCGGNGGRDLFYRVDLNARQVYLLRYVRLRVRHRHPRLREAVCAWSAPEPARRRARMIRAAAARASSRSAPSGESCIVLDQARRHRDRG